MDTFKLTRDAVLVLAVLAFAAQLFQFRRSLAPAEWINRGAAIAVAALGLLYIGITSFLWLNHIGFPLSLDLMEGTILQHFRRAASFQPIYPDPSPEYVPLAYNPLYYYLSVPFSWLFGANLFTLRLVSILGAIGAGCVIFLAVRQQTGSTAWGVAALGLYAAAYDAMDVYLDTAHADSWLLCSALIGSYLIDRGGTWRKWCGLLMLLAAFWFKQHGAFFVIGGVCYLTWHEGLRRSIGYWLIAAVLGPGLYIFGGPILFGPRFHLFTWEVPRRWMELNGHTVFRYFRFVARNYLVLAIGGIVYLLAFARGDRLKKLSVWEVQFVFALLAGFLGALDPGSSNNVFIPMGAFFILVGSIALQDATARISLARAYKLHLPVLLIVFGMLMYDPRPVIVSSQAGASYRDFVGMLRGLGGSIYAPWIGQMERDYTFYPAAHWVALEDMIRGPGAEVENHPNTRRLLAPALQPTGDAYIISNYPLHNFRWLAFLEEDYVLEADFGERFKPLRALPKYLDHKWPRYLYRYRPKSAVAPQGAGGMR